MFLTKVDLLNSIRALKSIEDFESEETQTQIAEYFARDMFPEYDQLSDDKKQEFLEMIISDMTINTLDIN